MSTLNWADLKKAAEDAGFSVVPKGTYNAVVSKATGAKTSNGKDQIKVTFKVLDGPQAGKPVNNNFIISQDNPVALGFFFRHMNALGLGAEYFAANPSASTDQIANDILNCKCQIDVSVEKWNDEDRNRVNAVKAMPNAVGAAVGISRSAMPQPSMPSQPQPVAQPKAAPVAPKAAPQPVVTDTAASEPKADVPAAPELPF